MIQPQNSESIPAALEISRSSHPLILRLLQPRNDCFPDPKECRMGPFRFNGKKSANLKNLRNPFFGERRTCISEFQDRAFLPAYQHPPMCVTGLGKRVLQDKPKRKAEPGPDGID
jgi:hypothetical protein